MLVIIFMLNATMEGNDDNYLSEKSRSNNAKNGSPIKLYRSSWQPINTNCLLYATIMDGVMRFVIRVWERLQLAIFCTIIFYRTQTCSTIQEIQKKSVERKGNVVSAGLQPNGPHLIPSKILQRVSKPRDGEYACLKTVICFVTHCCVYVANHSFGTKPE